MNHVMKPFQLSGAMWRLMGYGWKCQIETMELAVSLASSPLRVMVGAAAADSGQDVAPAPKTMQADEPATAPSFKRSRSTAKPKTKAEGPTQRAPRRRAPSNPPDMPAPADRPENRIADADQDNMPV